MTTQWGVYPLRGLRADGRSVASDDRSSVKWVQRWRVNGRPHKRTHSRKGFARAFHEELVSAKFKGTPADERGYPMREQDMSISPPVESSPGITFEDYCLDTWWPIEGAAMNAKNGRGHRDNMELAIQWLRYQRDDPRSGFDGNVGHSIFLADLTADDLKRALVTRRTTNKRIAAANQRMLNAADGWDGEEIALRPEVSSDATVRSFYVTLRMILRSAQASGWATDLKLDGLARHAPKPRSAPVSTRIVPSVDEVFDLADAIALLGPRMPDGRPAGERFRSLILVAGTAGGRPGELTAHSPEWIELESRIISFCRSGSWIYDPRAGVSGYVEGPLKHREDGEVRRVPLLAEVAEVLQLHLERGYDGPHSTWTSSTGRGRLDWHNLDAYWRPACERVFGAGEKRALMQMPPKVLRKAAVTFWLDSGIPAPVAAEWAGHSEAIAQRHYAGRIHSGFASETARLEASLDRVRPFR